MLSPTSQSLFCLASLRLGYKSLWLCRTVLHKTLQILVTISQCHVMTTQPKHAYVSIRTWVHQEALMASPNIYTQPTSTGPGVPFQLRPSFASGPVSWMDLVPVWLPCFQYCFWSLFLPFLADFPECILGLDYHLWEGAVDLLPAPDPAYSVPML